ncbi:MAG: phospholipid/glycerol acyltransferase, partial [Myxococcaceae bacterium]|nr:phospholipid/glycerol acyltransferase [Myxococcaceae bacterium]
MKALIRAVLTAVVRLYYPAIAVDGAERVPWSRPCLFVLNHPNGLLDPMLLRLGLDRPVRFLGKSTLFGNPLGRVTMEAFGGIPVFRHRDVAGGGGDPSRNEETFARCRAAFAQGDWIALFPEGTSHSDPTMKPFKTGAARIALSTVREHPIELMVVPVGLFYEQKATFRSRAVLSVGVALAAREYLDRYVSDERATVDALTDDVRRGLDAVVLQADTRELVEGVARVAQWTLRPDAREDLAASRRRAGEMLAAWRSLRERDAARADALLASGRRYLDAVAALGVRDPWALEVERVTPGSTARATARLVALAPLALAGVALGWPMYRLAGQVAARVVRDAEDVLGTVKLLAGLLLVPVGWIAAAAALGWRYGWWAAAAVAVLGPVGGYAALRWEEHWDGAMEALAMARLRAAQ